MHPQSGYFLVIIKWNIDHVTIFAITVAKDILKLEVEINPALKWEVLLFHTRNPDIQLLFLIQIFAKSWQNKNKYSSIPLLDSTFNWHLLIFAPFFALKTDLQKRFLHNKPCKKSSHTRQGHR